MTNKEYIAALSQKVGMSAEATQRMVSHVIDAMGQCFEGGDAVSIPNFGTFEVKKRMERVIVNPASGQRMLVPPKLVLGFKPAISLKNKLRSGGRDDE
ncbi:MAG: HU family DNA-binding protein [Prevotella sp.]|nr:HU family DNA-binding protein [Prevotella sp.]MBQ6209695.1 HU family DNA-binding protein [Prevotella sp.]